MRLRAALCVGAAALILPGCTHPKPAPAPAWVSAPDLPAIDRTLDSPSVRRLAESFLRSQDPARAAAGNTAIRRSGTPVTVYATNPGFVADPAAPLDRAGVASYIAVPVCISDRPETDTVQLVPTPSYPPRAVATGTEETTQPLPANSRLLLDYPTHTWLAWTRTEITVLTPGTTPVPKGRVFDAAQFRGWMTSR
ncbi:hypothetical protein [Nocardia terpenica]|uniref:Uncharacterized protein n=1 Tax=Nocardia terpenica TaxID=455432 RepID=A0A291REZ1_9NOCA|nr:hypothetical protein [Nocardia terpenica]ATL66133.1 hypothetical protein CRH09_07825 [Nocardia terpenica]